MTATTGALATITTAPKLDFRSYNWCSHHLVTTFAITVVPHPSAMVFCLP